MTEAEFRKQKKALARKHTLIGLTEDEIDMVLSKIDKRGRDECWEWTGIRDKRGYGIVNIRRTMHKAHRLVYALVHDRNRLAVIMHKCDNPPCCNPHHLGEGTHQLNMLDATLKGRMYSRDADRLDADDVRYIREMFENGARPEFLAEMHGVKPATIMRVVDGTLFPDVAEVVRTGNCQVRRCV
jgi:hypothetical protein